MTVLYRSANLAQRDVVHRWMLLAHSSKNLQKQDAQGSSDQALMEEQVPWVTTDGQISRVEPGVDRRIP